MNLLLMNFYIIHLLHHFYKFLLVMIVHQYQLQKIQQLP